MDLQTLTRFINEKLNGETLTYNDLLLHLDAVIDDINTKLSAKFPVFSEFTVTDYPDTYPNYNFFPDKFIRSVVIQGVASKFYTTDEEGIDSALAYSKAYDTALFNMLRDYSSSVPAEYQDYEQGFVLIPDTEPNHLDFDREATGGSELVW